MKLIRIQWTGHLDPFGSSADMRMTLPVDISTMEIFRVSSDETFGTAIATIPDEFLALALKHGVQIHATAREVDEHGNWNFEATPKIESSECHGEGISEVTDVKRDGRVSWQWKITARKKHPAYAHVSVRSRDGEIPAFGGLFVTHRLPVWYESAGAKRLIVVSVIGVVLSALAAVASAIAAWLSLGHPA